MSDTEDMSTAEVEAMERACDTYFGPEDYVDDGFAAGWDAARNYYRVKPDPQPRTPELEIEDGLGP